MRKDYYEFPLSEMAILVNFPTEISTDTRSRDILLALIALPVVLLVPLIPSSLFIG
jgi:hypothetical protein